MNIRQHLWVGRDNAIKIGTLAESLRLSRRDVEAAVQSARLEGVPIVSGSEGLWLASSDAEALAWCERQRSRAIHLMESAQGVQRGVERRAAHQETLWAA